MPDIPETRALIEAAKRLRAEMPSANVKIARASLEHKLGTAGTWWLEYATVIAFTDAVDALPPEKEQGRD